MLGGSLAIALGGCTADTTGLGPGPGADAGASADAAVRGDAGTLLDASVDAGTADSGAAPGVYWTIEERSDQTEIAIRRTTVPEGEVFIPLFMTTANACQAAGPANAEAQANHRVMIRSWFWFAHLPVPASCPLISDRVERLVSVTLTPGDWLIQIGTEHVTLTVTPVTDCSGDGISCAGDCACGGGDLCLPGAGDTRLCGRPCEPIAPDAATGADPLADLECGPSDGCVQDPSLEVPRCAPRASIGCSDDRPCPTGMSCPTSDPLPACRWAIQLSAAVRHPCTTDTDCDPALQCVEGREQERHCEVPCLTSQMPCPPQHVCQIDAVATDAQWVCEWQGE